LKIPPFTYEMSIVVAKIIWDDGRCPNKLQIEKKNFITQL